MPNSPDKRTRLRKALGRHTGKLTLAIAIAGASTAWLGGGGIDIAQAQQMPPAPQVEFTTLKPQQLREWSSYSGRLAAVESAAIKPLVGGAIEAVLFQEGQQVKAGDPLFVIDPRPHRNALAQAEAALATAEARLQLAEDEYARSEQLHDRKLISDSNYETALSNLQVAHATILQAQSAIEQARLNLDYAHVKAPIDGRVGRAELTVGNVVEAGANAPVLTTIIADNQLYAEFSVDEQSYIRFARSQAQQQDMPVELSLAQADGLVYQGHIHAFDNQMDSSSGTIRARALVENTDGVLTPGLYVNVRVGSAQEHAVLLVPEKAIGTNQNRRFVYVIADDSTAQYREVTLGGKHEEYREIMHGLAVGEQVVVNGVSHVRPNAPVAPVPLADSNLVSR